ncbi:hypothetical protein F2Q69_00028904 [Brassica cretica]|uniref:Uncharacterized protein n=1 Tax=Brassica cretica TaxID=69181 RepID=A0A8S9S632_BRACR|nr:hypothetical protein F2Q69_00028904 [Brassica cretica]
MPKLLIRPLDHAYRISGLMVRSEPRLCLAIKRPSSPMQDRGRYNPKDEDLRRKLDQSNAEDLRKKHDQSKAEDLRKKLDRSKAEDRRLKIIQANVEDLQKKLSQA